MSAAAASLALQKALFAALGGVATVYDGVPGGAAPPYVTIGPDAVTDAGWKGGAAFDHRLTLTCWTAGPAAAGAKALLATVEAVLPGVGGTVDGWTIMWARTARLSVTRAADGAAQAAVEVRARTVAA